MSESTSWRFDVGMARDGLIRRAAFYLHRDLYSNPRPERLCTNAQARSLVRALQRRGHTAHYQRDYLSFQEVPRALLKELCAARQIDFQRLRRELWWSRWDGQHYHAGRHLR